MQFPAADLCLRGKDADFGHQIVVNLPLDSQRCLDIDFVRVRPQIGDFGVGDQPGARLCLGERNPNRTPEFAAFFLGKERA